MKAPDKLFIGRRDYGPLIGGWESQPFTSKEIESIEYIRKDALLKWISEARTIPREYAQIRDLAFQEVVNYLNTM